jgi:hypothetical protein
MTTFSDGSGSVPPILTHHMRVFNLQKKEPFADNLSSRKLHILAGTRLGGVMLKRLTDMHERIYELMIAAGHVE